MVILSSLSIWAALQGRGPFHQLFQPVNTVSLQLFLIFAAVPFMVLAAVVEERKLAQEELSSDEEKLRLLLESAAEAIYGIDLEGRCTFCNPTCLRLLGYGSADALFGKEMHSLIHHNRAGEQALGDAECSIFHAFRAGEGVHSENMVLWRADGTDFPAEYWSHPMRKGNDVVGAVIAFIDITKRKITEQALAGVSRRLIEAQEQERARIARELHDDVVQRLALSTLELAQVQQSLFGGTSEHYQRIAALRQRIADISNDVQNMSHQLHPSKLEYLGLAVATQGFCREFAEQQKMKVDLESHDVPTRLPQEISLCLFRVLQEALQNAAKHSGVRHFGVRLWGESGEIHLTVVDSGVGFDLDSASRNKGLGLTSMQERARLVNGTFDIESKRTGGTTIHVRVPLQAEQNSFSQAS
jgi:PAS domain S-box-containing protein